MRARTLESIDAVSNQFSIMRSHPHSTGSAGETIDQRQKSFAQVTLATLGVRPLTFHDTHDSALIHCEFSVPQASPPASRQGHPHVDGRRPVTQQGECCIGVVRTVRIEMHGNASSLRLVEYRPAVTAIESERRNLE